MQGPVPHGGVYDYGVQGGHVSDPASGPISTPVSGHAPSPSLPLPCPIPHHRQIIIMGSHMVQIMGIKLLIPRQYLLSGAMGMDMTNQSMTIMLQCSILMDMEVPNQYIHKPAINQAIGAAAVWKATIMWHAIAGTTSPIIWPPRPSQPGDMPYQGPIQSSQSYGPNVPPQQQYPYASSGQSYPSNGSASGAEGNNQAMPTSGPGYPQQEQPASNNAGYGYQGSQDPAYGSGPGATYSAPPSGQQAYAQPTATQPSYDHSVPQSGAYGAAPGSAPVGYGKNLVSLAHLPSI
ncbi:hypothetical protein GH714_012790 [Hevea brasiliensis]|uniref:Uncharacterized protein n=1 Tax=Hevea brasiliensis TaxID=3981 RepID=A0A6A6KR30_HEVBR|nr:hypothetical protein GH714_012790 [Hevea brasiliensis]